MAGLTQKMIIFLCDTKINKATYTLWDSVPTPLNGIQKVKEKQYLYTPVIGLQHSSPLSGTLQFVHSALDYLQVVRFVLTPDLTNLIFS